MKYSSYLGSYHLTMGQLVKVFQQSDFLDASAQLLGKDHSSLRIIDLEQLVQLRNRVIHSAREASRTEAEFLFNCLRVMFETFELVDAGESESQGETSMDLITLILRALDAWNKALDSSKTAARNAYADLHSGLTHKFAGKPAAEMALAQYEQQPETWEAPLKEALIKAEADRDQQIITTAQALLELLRAPQDQKTSQQNIVNYGDVEKQVNIERIEKIDHFNL